MRAHRPDGRRPDDAAVRVVVRAAVIEVRVEAPLRRVALPQEILAIEIRDHDFLLAVVEGVQLRVRVLLAHVEAGHVVLETIVYCIAEDPRAEIDVVENESAKVGVERLKPAAKGEEVVVIRQVSEVNFNGRLLQRQKIPGAFRVARSAIASSLSDLPVQQPIDVRRVRHGTIVRRRRVVVAADGTTRIRRHHARLARIEVVHVVNRFEFDRPFHRLERRLALEELHRESEIVLNPHLLALTVKLVRARHRRAHSAGRRHATKLHFRLRTRRKVQENILPDDRHVALEHALLVRMPKLRLRRSIRLLRHAAGVAPPRHETDAPPVWSRLGIGRIRIRPQRILRQMKRLIEAQVPSRVLAGQLQRLRQRLLSEPARHRGYRRKKFTTPNVRSWQSLLQREAWRNKTGRGQNIIAEQRRHSRRRRRTKSRARIGIELRRCHRRIGADGNGARPVRRSGQKDRQDELVRIGIEDSGRLRRHVGADDLMRLQAIRVIRLRRACSQRLCGTSAGEREPAERC